MYFSPPPTPSPHLLLPVRQCDDHAGHALPLVLLQALDLPVVDQADPTVGHEEDVTLRGVRENGRRDRIRDSK